MNASLSLPPTDLDGKMRRIAREVAMDLYSLDQILKNCDTSVSEFDIIKKHPRFAQYYSQFKDEWNAATNTKERTKIKAGLVMEEFMEEAYTTLHDKKHPLNHRVELGKLVAKIAEMGEPKVNVGANGGPGFSLTINIGDNKDVTIAPEMTKIINHDPSPNNGRSRDDFDSYDPFTSPNTLDGL